MAKKSEYFDIAEKMFVNEFCTFAEIAAKLNVNAQTISNWCKSGKWKKKQKALIESRKAFDQELYELAREISKSITEDLRAGNDIAPARYFSMTRIIEVLPKAQKYEKNIDVKDTATVEDILDKVREALLNG